MLAVQPNKHSILVYVAVVAVVVVVVAVVVVAVVAVDVADAVVVDEPSASNYLQ